MSDDKSNSETSFINSHTHVFSKHNVPNYLGRQIIWKPFYKLFTTPRLIWLIDKIIKPNRDKYSYSGRNKEFESFLSKKFWTKTPGISFLYYLFLGLLWTIFGYYLLDLIRPLVSETLLLGWLCKWTETWLCPFMPDLGSKWNSIILLLIFIIFVPNIGNTVRKYLWSRILKTFGKETIELYLRYLNLVKYANKKDKNRAQALIFNSLEQQYPVGTKFVVLPMDMEHIDAGPVPASYDDQMQEILRLKKNNKDTCYPFIFVDPRRIEADNIKQGSEIKGNENSKKVEKRFLSFNTQDIDNIELKDCLVNDYIEGGCAGIKIYPALGYYPFDKALLFLWLYCQQKNIPVTTHCSIGPIFYRGKLKDLEKEFYLHPIFDEVYKKNKKTDKETIGRMRFHQLKNKHFQKNFTHPLNYLCLLHKPLLNKVVETFDEDGDLKTLFDYKDGMITRDLSNLKINLAHYGSAEMWEQFLEQGRYSVANAIIKDPKNGLDLKGTIDNRAKRFSYWYYVDWFSIISTMMMQFDNVYTDVSYTSHDLKYLSLLSEILDNPKIRERVLFGTDFYVVSNHKTEKQYWIDMQNSLGYKKWNHIANINSTEFLTSLLPGSI